MFLPLGGKLTDVENNEPLRASDQAARASLPPPLKGSMTLEAAVAVPLFLFFMMNLLFLFEAVRLQSGLQAALQQAGEQVCEAAYYTRFGTGNPDGESGTLQADGGSGEALSLILSETYVRNKVASYLGDSFWKHSCIVGGKAGLSFAKSKIMTEGDRVEIIVNCRIRPFVRIIAFPDFSMQARYCGHAWVGWTQGSGGAESGSGGSGGRVYVTTYGEVYHRDPGCIYLNPQIRAVSAAEAENCRSGDGSKYYPCECCRPGENGIVYITKEGNRYHSDRNCSGLVRHLSTMESDAAKERYRPCPKCGGSHQGGHETGSMDDERIQDKASCSLRLPLDSRSAGSQIPENSPVDSRRFSGSSSGGGSAAAFRSIGMGTVDGSTSGSGPYGSLCFAEGKAGRRRRALSRCLRPVYGRHAGGNDHGDSHGPGGADRRALFVYREMEGGRQNSIRAFYCISSESHHDSCSSCAVRGSRRI